MRSVNSEKATLITRYSYVACENSDTSSAIATERTFPAIRIEVNHFKVMSFNRLEQYKSVGTDSVPSVTEACDELRIIARYPSAGALVEHDKVVASALIFTEMHD